MAQDPSSSDPAAPSLPCQGILCADRVESLRDHLEQLSDELRRCFLLRYHRGFGEQQIAVLMKLPVDRVKACLEQARQSLGFGREVF
jgi:DNA-directed RNA polymerase specialized sigma24 family protein